MAWIVIQMVFEYNFDYDFKVIYMMDMIITVPEK
jgi:hypothetical protein